MLSDLVAFVLLHYPEADVICILLTVVGGSEYVALVARVSAAPEIPGTLADAEIGVGNQGGPSCTIIFGNLHPEVVPRLHTAGEDHPDNHFLHRAHIERGRHGEVVLPGFRGELGTILVRVVLPVAGVRPPVAVAVSGVGCALVPTLGPVAIQGVHTLHLRHTE